MSSPVRAGRAGNAIAHADEGLGKWLQDLATGEGTSPSHIIITGVIGVVPGLGQAFDVRDLILGVVALTRSPASPLLWVDLLITLVGCIPAAGDAFKVCFKMIRHGHGVGRVLDTLRGVLKGDVNKWLKNIDWGTIAARARKTLDETLDAFIGGLDTWPVKSIAGRGNVNMAIEELKGIRRIAPKYLDEAANELKTMHRKILDDLTPASTAAQSRASGSKTTGTSTPPKASERTSGSTTGKTDKTADNQGTTDTRKHDQTREARKKKDRWREGVLPEHITDYHIAKRHRNFRKINDHGRKVEEHDSPRGVGIDHVWKNTSVGMETFEQSGGKGGKPYVIGETKGSLLGSFAFLAALTPELREHFEVLRADEDSGATPNIFGNEKRDSAPAKKAEVTTDQGVLKRRGEEGEWEQGLNGPNEETGLPTQMSHEWVFRQIGPAVSIVAGEKSTLKESIKGYRKGRYPCAPYHRWILMVSGREKFLHERSKKMPPHMHEIARPIVVIPDHLLVK